MAHISRYIYEMDYSPQPHMIAHEEHHLCHENCQCVYDDRGAQLPSHLESVGQMASIKVGSDLAFRRESRLPLHVLEAENIFSQTFVKWNELMMGVPSDQLFRKVHVFPQPPSLDPKRILKCHYQLTKIHKHLLT